MTFRWWKYHRQIFGVEFPSFFKLGEIEGGILYPPALEIMCDGVTLSCLRVFMGSLCILLIWGSRLHGDVWGVAGVDITLVCWWLSGFGRTSPPRQGTPKTTERTHPSASYEDVSSPLGCSQGSTVDVKIG